MVSTALARMRGMTVDTLSASTGGQEFYVNRARNGFSVMPLGERVLASAGRSRLFVCTSQDARCAVFDAAGRQRGTFTIDLVRSNVSDRQWELAKHRLVNEQPTVEERELRSEVLKELSRPRRFPLIDQVRSDPEDRLWVRTFTGYGSDPASWLVVSPAGKPLARALLPQDLQILEIGKDYLLGLTRDADQVESVGLYPLRVSIP